MKKLLITILILILIPSISFAAISFGGADSANHGTTGTSLTFAFTVSGSNPILWCGVVGDVSDTTQITGVTYNSISMTQVNKALVPGNREIYLFELPNPSTGSNNVVVSAAGSILIGSACSYYNGAAQTQNLGTDIVTSTATGSSVPNIRNTVTTTVDNSWVFMMTLANGETSYTASDGVTGLSPVNRMTDTVTYGYTLADGGIAKTPAGQASIAETFGGGNRNVASIMASFSPAISTSIPVSKMQIISWWDE